MTITAHSPFLLSSVPHIRILCLLKTTFDEQLKSFNQQRLVTCINILNTLHVWVCVCVCMCVCGGCVCVWGVCVGCECVWGVCVGVGGAKGTIQHKLSRI